MDVVASTDTDEEVFGSLDVFGGDLPGSVEGEEVGGVGFTGEDGEDGDDKGSGDDGRGEEVEGLLEGVSFVEGSEESNTESGNKGGNEDDGGAGGGDKNVCVSGDGGVDGGEELGGAEADGF